MIVLNVLSLRYSSWSIRALLPLLHAGAAFDVKTVEFPMERQGDAPEEKSREVFLREGRARLAERRALGCVAGLVPVLWVDGEPIHEALAINEWTAETYAYARLWPEETLRRAQARALSAEMAAGFRNIRGTMSCHVFARVPGFVPDGPTQLEIERVFSLCAESLQRSGGPYLFGDFGVVDAMYFPVFTRFRTYGVPLPEELRRYEENLYALPAVQRFEQLARQAPRIPVYDAYVRSLGGEVDEPPG